MLRITQSTSADAAKGYHDNSLAREGYYHEGRDAAGRWGGLGAERLGLLGNPVSRDDFHALCDNLNPLTDERLTQRTRGERRPGIDCTWNCPKSVSLLAAFGHEGIVEAVRGAVADAMAVIEKDVKTRVRKGGKDTDRPTGNMIYAEFVHHTARPIDGISDPNLHVHCFAMNATFDEVEQRWKAAQFGTVKSSAYFHEAVFHAKLSERLAAMGYGIERHEKGWEVSGVPRSAIEKFSRRTALIEEVAKAKGITRAEDKARLGATTREGKHHSLLEGEAQRREWDARLTPGERAAILGAKGVKAQTPALSAGQAMDHAVGHGYERSAVLAERRLMASALKAGVGGVTLEQIECEIARPGMITKDVAGERLTTTKDVLSIERRYLEFARNGRGAFRPLGAADYRIPAGTLSPEQERAASEVFASRDAVVILEGRAGTGKSTTLAEIRAGLIANGREVHAYAPTASARDGLQGLGFDAETVARLLVDPRQQERLHAQSVVLIDEVGLLSARQLAEVTDLCGKHGARLILVGDERQHGSVESGGNALRLLESHAGVKPVAITEIWRQRHEEYKSIVSAISQGDLAGSFDRLDSLQWIREIPGPGRYQVMAADYVRSVESGHSTLAISPSHAEGAKISEAIRSEMKAKGLIGQDERPVRSEVNLGLTQAQRSDPVFFHPDQVVRFHRACKGFKAGERVVVTGRDGSGHVEIRRANGETTLLPLVHADRYGVFDAREIPVATGDRIRIGFNGKTLDGKHRLTTGDLHPVAGFTDENHLRLANGWVVSKDYGGLASGLVVTSHVSQSKSFDTVLVGQSAMSLPASSSNQWYVSLSRGRNETKIYTDDKAALKAAIQAPEHRPSATELVEASVASKPKFREQLRQHAERLNRLAYQARAYASRTIEGWRERVSPDRGRTNPQKGNLAHER